MNKDESRLAQGNEKMLMEVMRMARRFFLAVLWSIAVYFGACFFVGAGAGVVAGLSDPAHAATRGMDATTLAVASIRFPLVFGALIVGMAGNITSLFAGRRLARETVSLAPPSSVDS
jgi:hypothetical protein